MNKKQLSLAILVAMGLTACGSSSKGGTGDDNNGKDPKTPVVDPSKDPVKDVVIETDPTLDTLDPELAKRKFEEHSSIHAKFYVKGATSRFDTKNTVGNSKAPNIDTYSIEESSDGDETFTNYLIGRENVDAMTSNDNSTTRFAGLHPDKTGSIADPVGDMLSLQEHNAADTGHADPGHTFNVALNDTPILVDEMIKPTSGNEDTNGYNDGQNADYDADTNNGLLFGYDFSGKFTRDDFVGSDEEQGNSTRYFGAKFMDLDNSEEFNTYSGVEISNEQSAAVVSGKDYYTNTTTITPTKSKLEHVQYGRITNNIDPDGSGKYAIAPATTQSDAKAVSNYFYRGLNATTPDQMASLPAGKVLNYTGHAITYGLNHNVKVGDSASSDRPTSVSEDASNVGLTVIGSFVDASYHVDDKKVNGEVFDYVVVKDLYDHDTASTRDRDTAAFAGSKYRGVAKNTLIDFSGNVVGNTFIGEAKASHSEPKGKVKGSFFGPKASEMGGVISSVAEGYGYGSWGASFGAQRNATISVNVNGDTGGNSDFVSDDN